MFMKTSQWLSLIIPVFKHVYFFLAVLSPKSMNEVYNDGEYTPSAADTTSDSCLKDEELLEVLKTLGSQGFRIIYHEN